MIGDLDILDFGPLGTAGNPGRGRDAERLRAWIERESDGGSAVMVADVVVYEVRRELIRAGRGPGLRRLAEVMGGMERIPITETAWDRAAELWAEARRRGVATAKDDALDAALLIAAVAQLAAEAGWNAVVVTGNPAHIGRFADVRDWRTPAAH